MRSTRWPRRPPARRADPRPAAPRRLRARPRGLTTCFRVGTVIAFSPGLALASSACSNRPSRTVARRSARPWSGPPAMHADQRRALDRAPFILHPLEVASLLNGRGFDDEVIAAGVLHDVVENTTATVEDVVARFGERVAAIVAAVSEDPSIGDYVARKAALREQAAAGDRGARRLRGGQDRQGPRAALPGRVRPGRARGPADRAKLEHYEASLSAASRRRRPADGRPARVRAVGPARAAARSDADWR